MSGEHELVAVGKRKARFVMRSVVGRGGLVTSVPQDLTLFLAFLADRGYPAAEGSSDLPGFC